MCVSASVVKRVEVIVQGSSSCPTKPPLAPPHVKHSLESVKGPEPSLNISRVSSLFVSCHTAANDSFGSHHAANSFLAPSVSTGGSPLSARPFITALRCARAVDSTCFSTETKLGNQPRRTTDRL
ncbi:uncharacterized protein V6R79_021021 [Siganus canaliculatus]